MVLADVGKPATGQPAPTAALLSKDGSVVFVGQPRGVLTVVDASSLRIHDVVKVTSGSQIVCLTTWQGRTPLVLTHVVHVRNEQGRRARHMDVRASL